MLNYLWGLMIITGITYGAFFGRMDKITAAAIDSCAEAVSLCITMLGIMGMWSGIMKIAEKSGLIEKASQKLGGFIDYIFPDIPKEHKSREYITTNIIANVLGLGWAATPAGLLAMKSLKELNNNSIIASSSMCNFLILNISSLQLIPINMIAYRAKYGSVNPSLITAPAIVATFISTIAAIIFIKMIQRVCQ